MKKRALFMVRIAVFLCCAGAIAAACDETATEECTGNVGCCAFDELYGYPFMSSYCTDTDLSYEKEGCLTPAPGGNVGTWTDAVCKPPKGTGGCIKPSQIPGSMLEEGVVHWTPGYDEYAFGTCTEENMVTYGEGDPFDSPDSSFEKEYVNEDAIYNIAIVSHNSDFKKNLIQLLVDAYQDRASLYIFEIANLADVVPGNYDVIIILDWCAGDLPSLSDFANEASDPLDDYITGISDSDKIVLAVTTGPENDYTCRNDTSVDAITSASSADDTSSVFDDISTKIDQIIPAG